MLRPAHTPALDTCAGRELIALASTREADSLWLNPSPRAPGPARLLRRKGEGCSKTAREVVDLMRSGNWLGIKGGDITMQEKRYRLGVSVQKGRCHLLACIAEVSAQTLSPLRAASGIPGLSVP